MSGINADSGMRSWSKGQVGERAGIRGTKRDVGEMGWERYGAVEVSV